MTRFQANMVLALTAMIWGSSFVVQQVGTGGMGMISFTGASFFVGGIIALPLAIRQLRRMKKEDVTLPPAA